MICPSCNAKAKSQYICLQTENNKLIDYLIVCEQCAQKFSGSSLLSNQKNIEEILQKYKMESKLRISLKEGRNFKNSNTEAAFAKKSYKKSPANQIQLAALIPNHLHKKLTDFCIENKMNYSKVIRALLAEFLC